jgi:hypothetical protein
MPLAETHAVAPPTETDDADAAGTIPVASLTAEPTIELVGTGGVARVQWVTNEPADGDVYFGEDGTLDHHVVATTSDDGLSHEALVVGLSAGGSWEVEARSRTATQRWTSERVPLSPPPAPATLPAINLAARSDDSLPGLILTTHADRAAGAVMILDRRGRYVWWHATPFDMLPLMARLSPDGTAVEWLENGQGENTSMFHREALDGSWSTEFEAPHAHHGFVALPDGGWVVIESDTRSWGDATARGDRLVELDEEGNEVREVWSTWDDLSPPEDFDAEEAEDPEWTHMNAVVYLPDTDKYLVSLYTLNAIFQIDRATGTVDWQLGGDDSDFTFPHGGQYDHLHSPRLLPDGHLLLFDNGPLTGDDRYSEVIEYAVDMDARTVVPVWSHDAHRGIYASVLGSAERLDDGDTFISWGAGSRYTQVGPTGAVRWELDLADGAKCGFAQIIETSEN